MLQANYTRITKDSDVLEADPLTPAVCDRLLAIAGQNTQMHVRHKLYLDMVRPGLPFLPPSPKWHELPDLGHLEHFHILVLDVVDVVVSKFGRFSTNDQFDIDAMIDLGLVPHDLLIDRFRSAVDAFAMDARANKLTKYISYLHRIERDSFNVDPTTIELPAGVVELE
jgi:hypothetical protein